MSAAARTRPGAVGRRVLLLVAAGALAAGALWPAGERLHTDPEVALAVARERGGPVVVFLVRPDRPAAARFLQTTLADTRWLEPYSDEFTFLCADPRDARARSDELGLGEVGFVIGVLDPGSGWTAVHRGGQDRDAVREFLDRVRENR